MLGSFLCLGKYDPYRKTIQNVGDDEEFVQLVCGGKAYTVASSYSWSLITNEAAFFFFKLTLC